jgi:hypothetical protein
LSPSNCCHTSGRTCPGLNTDEGEKDIAAGEGE